MKDRFAQSILDTLAAHVAVVDDNGTILAVNKAWTSYTFANSNTTLAACGVGANYLDVAGHATGPYSEDGSAVCSGIRGVLDGSIPEFSLEYPCHTPTEQHWFRLTVSPLDGTPSQVVISHLDITPRKRLEWKLRESEEFLNELALHIGQTLWVIDAREAKILYVSPSYERVWGRTCQSLLDNPQSYMDGIHPLDEVRMRAEEARLYQTGQAEAECRILHPDGTVRWVCIKAYPVREAGEIIRLVGVTEDITDRKLAADETARLAAIIEYADDSIVSLTLEGIVISWNQGAERLYGYLAEEMIGHSIMVLHTTGKQDEYLAMMARIKRGERVAAFETVRLRKDGTRINVSLSASAIEVHPGLVTGATKISHDITRIKLLEEQFRQAQKMEAVGTLAGGVAHDFNNLLTVINGYSELLLEQLDLGDPMRQLLDEIHKAGVRAGRLTRQLLAFSRKQLLEPKVLNLNAVVADTEIMLGRLIGEDIILTVVLDPVLRTVKVDPGQIQQVLMNLAVNARDAMPKGGRLTIETRHIALDESYNQFHPETRPGEYAMVAVTDTGTGMDEVTKARIFEPFFTTKEEGKGTGLGMAVVHGVVRQSGANIEVYSELGRGTTFKLYFPIADEAVIAASPSNASIKMPTGTETVLLVEDEESVRALSRYVLQSCGYTVLEASNGLDAIRVAQSYTSTIHLMVTDVVMPILGGRELAEQLETIRPGVKVLFLSGYTDDAIVRHGILEADVAFLQKPFCPTTLTQKVRDVLDAT